MNQVLWQFLIGFVAILTLSYLINYFLMYSFLGRAYRIFVAPGVILHELSHALFCKLTGAEIKKIAFFEKDGGSVTHLPPKLPLGQLFISLAPFFIGLMVLYYLFQMIAPSFNSGATGLGTSFLNIFNQINWRDYFSYVILYLSLSIIVTLTPSWQDLKNILLTVVILGGFGFLIFYFGDVNLNVLSGWAQSIWPFMAVVLSIMLFGLALSFLLYLLTKLFLK